MPHPKTLTPAALQAARQSLVTVRDWLRWAVTQFNQADIYYGHGTDNPWDEAWQLILFVLHCSYTEKAFLVDCRLTAPEMDVLADLITRRINERKPAAYLTQQAWFAGLPFYVDERVLIPRSPLAELIAKHVAPWFSEEMPPERILDICTGSGCIAAALAHAFPDAMVDASDISPDALAVARINIERLGLLEQVHLYQSDIFNELPQVRYDLIISNPPYVPAQSMVKLPAEYRHEPELGLVADHEGLAVAEKILATAADYLTENGVLVVEVGESWPQVEQRWPQVPWIWLDFEQGGEGVFAITRTELKKYF